MRFDRLTSSFQAALADAQSQALGFDHAVIEPEHLLKAMIDDPQGTCRPLLAQSGVNIGELKSKLQQRLLGYPKVTGGQGDIHPSNQLIRLLNQTDKLAQQHQDQFIPCEWFILAAAEDSSPLGTILKECGAKSAVIKNNINALRAGEHVTDPNAEESRQALNLSLIHI